MEFMHTFFMFMECPKALAKFPLESSLETLLGFPTGDRARVPSDNPLGLHSGNPSGVPTRNPPRIPYGKHLGVSFRNVQGILPGHPPKVFFF